MHHVSSQSVQIMFKPAKNDDIGNDNYRRDDAQYQGQGGMRRMQLVERPDLPYEGSSVEGAFVAADRRLTGWRP